MFFFRSFLFAVLLTACDAPIADVTTGGSIHTGRSFAFAKPTLVYRDDIATVFASPAYEESNGQRRYRVLVSVSRNDLNYPKITGAWSFAQRLQYAKNDRRRNFCNPDCEREEFGVIQMSRASFLRYAEAGFAFQLEGKRGSYHGAIPAVAFARVLARNDAMQ